MINFILFLSWAGASLTLFIGTFVMYVAIMKMREVQNEIYRLHWSVRWVCYFILLIGLIFDTLLNWIVLTILFVELPHEFLSTTRIVRHKYTSTHWRQDMALWFCENWLSPFDKSHCEL